MAGHGSAPAEDRGNHPGRKVGRPLARLGAAMQWQGILSSSETASAVSGLQEGREYTSEAVGHYGGASKLASDAFRNRNRIPR